MQIPSVVESAGSLDEPFGPGVDPGAYPAEPLAGDAAIGPDGSVAGASAESAAPHPATLQGSAELATEETSAGRAGGRAEGPNRIRPAARRPDGRVPRSAADATGAAASFAAIVAAWTAGAPSPPPTDRAGATAPPAEPVRTGPAGRPRTDRAQDAQAAAATGADPAHGSLSGARPVDVAAWLATVIPAWAPGAAVAPARVGHGVAGESPAPDTPSSSQPPGQAGSGELGPAEILGPGPAGATAATAGRVPAAPPPGPPSSEPSDPTATADPPISLRAAADRAAEGSGAGHRRPTAFGEAVDPGAAEPAWSPAAAASAPERPMPPERAVPPERPVIPAAKATPVGTHVPDAAATVLGSTTVAPPATTEPVDPPARVADAAAAAEHILTVVAERIRLAVRDRLPALEATFHDPALGPVRLAVRGLPDGPIAADLVVASAHAARALGRAAGELRSLAEAGIELRIRIESGASPAAVTEARVEVRAGHGHPAAGPASSQSGPTTDDGRGFLDDAGGRRFLDDAGGPGSNAGRGSGREPAADGGGGAPAGSEMAIAATRNSRGGRPLGGRSPATRPSLGPGLAAGAIDLRL
jgi:hypothetical protein